MAGLGVTLAWVFNAALLTVGAFALWKGGRPEKLGALVNVLACLVSAGLQVARIADWYNDGPIIAVDAVTMLAFLWLGCCTNRFWPIWSMGFALAIVAIDAAKIIVPYQAFVFGSGQVIYAYLALGSVAIGTYRVGWRGSDRDGFRPHGNDTRRL